MRRLRTTKAIAARVDPTYVRRPQKLFVIRRLLILACCVGALGWWGYYFARGDQTIYSPGPVASVHAMWEADCAKCHNSNPNPAGGFVRSVSDSACLKCHDGPIHHVNQGTMITRVIGIPPQLNVTTAPVEPQAVPRSANCASCHVEHRGHEVLRARDDAHCTQCHQNVTPVSKDGAPHIRPDINGFSLPSHPAFGRRLTTSKQWSPASASEPLVDVTPLKFNHKIHMPLVNAPAGQANNCAVCHQPGSNASSDGRRYMKPLSYQANCASCHPLGLTGGVRISHAPLSIVRRELADLPGLYREWLMQQPQTVRAKELVKEKKGPAPTFKITRTAITPDVWAQDKAKLAAGEFESRYAERLDTPGHKELDEAGPDAATNPAGGPSTSVLELMIAYDPPAGTACAKCHTVTGQPWAVYQKALTAIASAPATTTQAAAQPLSTSPTGFGSASRRWFTASQFDHDKHRSMSCIDCHAQALTSALTSDVMLPKLESCVQCHHAPTSASRGAGAQCQTCHTFHDRTRENALSHP